MASLVLAALLALQATPAAGPALIEGEAIRVDLARRQLVVRTTDPLRETAFLVDESRTRMWSGGRAVGLDRVRPGEWLLVAYEPAGAQRLAVLVKIGAARPRAGARRQPSS
jgi:hypothetical protein